MQHNQVWYTKSAADTLSALDSNLNQGLSEIEAQARQEQFGLNELIEQRRQTPAAPALGTSQQRHGA